MGSSRIHKILLIGLFCCLGWAQEALAQRPEVFPEDSTAFFKEMEKYFRDTKKKEARQFMKEFEEIWFGGHFEDKERQKVYDVCNKMNEERMLPIPEFYNYLNSVMRYKNSGKPFFIFENWHKSIDNLLEGSKRRYVEFLEFSSHLFEFNALYYTSRTKWISNNEDFIFGYEEEPVVYFPSLTLKCYSKGDSSVIYDTEGKLYPMKGIFKGKNGRVTWQRAGFNPEEVYAELDQYKIETRHPYFDADSVYFQNPNYFGDAILKGYLEEKVLANVTPEKASYPRFSSYNKRIKIKNIVDNIDFEGGFSQQGSKFLGRGTSDDPASLIFYKDGYPFLTAISTTFSIRPDRILTERAEIDIALGQDSIYHPGVKMQFLIDERLLSLIRTGDDITKSPYYNTYHMIDMRFEALYWKVDDPIITMEALFGSTNRDALFESLNFFKEERYDQLYRIDDEHPLVKIYHCMKKFDRDYFTVKEIAQCSELSMSQTRVMLLELSNFGYLSYDFDEGKVQIKDKLTNFILAKSGNVDYDVLQFISKPDKGINAQLNLLNYDLTIKGLEGVLLSDSHMVYIYPKGKEITMKKNRDFVFDGILNAGNFEVFGTGNTFLYDEFKFDLPQMDSVRIYVNTEEKNQYGMSKQARVKTVLEDLKGSLRIDSPNNKSGLKPLNRYPIFTSERESYAYYDDSYTQGGVYNRDNFSFQLEPFEVDSLDNFENKSLRFKGTFESAGIFPEFDEELTLQPDYSLGFVRPTPPEGYEVYGGKGKFFNDIKLSAEGLKGDGYLEYITSTTESKDLVFHPDSAFGIAENYIIEEQMGEVEYPPVSGQGVFVKWQPLKDFMNVFTRETPLKFYDGSSSFSGRITYNPKELRGGGKYEFQEAEMYSKDYLFKFIEFYSDTADFRLRSLADNALTFNTSNVNAHVDFQERKAEFISNGGTTLIELPENQYIAKMDRFTWYMDNEEIELSGGEVSEAAAKKGLDLEGSKFTSIHPDQDSLSFYSSAAKFNYNTKIIRAEKVKLIQVGDAFVYPDSGKVTVRLKANMDPLKEAKIVANSITEYHTIFDAELKIKGRLDYSGKGKIEYVDENQNKQIIKLENIYLDTTYQTIATGEINQEVGFTLSPNYQYYGDVRLEAAKPLLLFSGYTKIFHTCSSLPLEWFQFRAEIDPDEIYIPVDSMISGKGSNDLTTGIMMGEDPFSIYSTFFSETERRSDQNLFNAKGFLYYDDPSSSYIISNLQKINQKTLPGNYLVLNKNNCSLNGEGRFRLGIDLGRVDNKPSGEITHFTLGDSLVMEFVWLMNFYLEKKAIKIMANALLEDETLDRTDFDTPLFKKGVQELLGKEETDRIIAELSLNQKYKRFPKGLDKTIFFNDVKFIWDPISESYKSVGPIGIGNVEKDEINKYVDGKIQIVKKRSGDELNIYLELSKSNWYFFNYRAEMMQTVSSNDEYNTAIKESKKNKLKREKGQAKYRFLLSSEAKKIQFLRKFEE